MKEMSVVWLPFIKVEGFVKAGLRETCKSDFALICCVSFSAGISQSRISHWLLQQGSDLSEQKKRAFYRWYQLEKTTPGNTQHQCHLLLQDVQHRSNISISHFNFNSKHTPKIKRYYWLITMYPIWDMFNLIY